MAVSAEIEWFNPVNGVVELVNGVLCSCYECRNDPYAEGYVQKYTPTIPDGWYLPFTKNEYKRHQDDRRRSYFDRKQKAATKDGMARTKEITEAEAVWEGRPVPTFFDIKTGKWISYEDPVHEFDRLFGSKSIYDTSNRGL